jgi:hypothetical protein
MSSNGSTKKSSANDPNVGGNPVCLSQDGVRMVVD